ncbi:MAG TPA: 16S rRNA (adenine(1518)-N(6)/adenine(1519)-N(6))-dimethyltransferase RsmA [Patescibacteria group bacterium]|nr:16S rRNA (adenine(1518)-N(6)/adenine(1519)-N(6))-dimethyltransferase RsmA [Patescibacteria group bacterium]
MSNILTDPVHLKNLLKSLGLKPKDYLGQNFLISEETLAQILDAAQITEGETIVEIGPGLGVLTERLVAKAGRVVAIEKDRMLVPVLRKFFRKQKNLEIVQGDVLKFNFENISGPYKIVANIPYYLTSHLLQNFFALSHQPEKIILMVQKEVGERLVAKAGQFSLLGISVQIFADVEIEAIVPAENFWPVPKVDSAIIVITPKKKFPEIKDEKLFFRILKVAFAGKRKQIHNTLANGLKLPKEKVRQLLDAAGIEPTTRPQDLEIEDWTRLYKHLLED